MTDIVLVTGAGGVGKTTIAAGLAATAARAGRKTLVLTVDPARRLADALGLGGGIGNVPTPVPGSELLFAAMLDARSSWETIAKRHTDPETADRLIENRFFRAVADRFPAGQAYAAADELTSHSESEEFELIVVDTPPSGGGIEFFTAPKRIRRLVGGRVLKWLTGPQLPGSRALYRYTARPVLRVADTVLGGPLLEDVAEFLLDLRTTYDGVARRARTIERCLKTGSSVVVTTTDPTPIREAVRFFRELPDVATSPQLVIFNRSIPKSWSQLGDTGPANPLGENLRRWAAESRRQQDVQEEFADRYDAEGASVPWLVQAPTSLDSLLAMVDAGSDSLRRLIAD